MKSQSHTSSAQASAKNPLSQAVLSDEGENRTPDMTALLAHLHFSPSEGRVWLDDQRMLLIHASSLSMLRRELIDSVGTERARGILTRMGYNSGVRDAELARKLSSTENYLDMFSVGPQLHALEGIVLVEPVRIDIDIEKGHFYGEFIWKDSSDAELHLQNYGIGVDAVCWMQVGYASGYTSAFLGRPILYREVECYSLGKNQCRIIGKPIEAWPDAELDLRYMQVDATSAQNPAVGLPANEQFDVYLQQHPQRREDEQMVGVSASFNVAYQMMKRVATTQATVLLCGESGVGKEVFAKALHRHSERSEQPFVALNCAAIPEHLVEAELFGVEKGAFTGALQTRIGRFERAHQGTLFLDEIGVLSLSAQSKILRAIQEGEIERVGDCQTRKVSVRLIAATNLDLKTESEAGRFREDLYFRLNVFPIQIPPLRDRRADIPLLMHHFLQKFSQRDSRHFTGFTARAINALLSYRWPGNIRELENMIERGTILASENGPIDLPHLFNQEVYSDDPTFRLGKNGQLIQDVPEPASIQEELPDEAALLQQISQFMQGTAQTEEGFSLDRLEQLLLNQAVQSTQGNLAAAARKLGISRPQLVYRLGKEAIKSGIDGKSTG